MKAVDVFVGTNATDHRFRVYVLRQRHLHENAVDAIVGIESIDDLEELLLSDRGGTSNRFAMHPELVARPLLRADVYCACRVVAHEDDRQPRRDATRLQYLNLRSHLDFYVLGEPGAVDDLFVYRCISEQSPPPESPE